MNTKRYAPDRARVRILTVDPSTRRVEAGLRDGGVVQVAIIETGPFFRWPVEGETWTIQKRDNTWFLNCLIEDRNDAPIEDLAAGDAKINTDSVYTKTGQILLAPTVGMGMSWFGVDDPPRRWLVTDGTEVSRTTYVALFNVIGIVYGDGDGSTTFNLPTATNTIIYTGP